MSPSLLLLAFVVVLPGCSRRGSVAADASATSIADTPRVAPEDETYFADLPGVEGFERLTPEMQAAVAARANRARCDCGCFGHSVNACLHQQEECDVALEAASRFVEEAALAERLAGGTPAAEPEPEPEPEPTQEGTADPEPDSPEASAPEGPTQAAGSSGPDGAADAATGASGPAAGSSPATPTSPGGESGPQAADQPAPEGGELPVVAPLPGPSPAPAGP